MAIVGKTIMIQELRANCKDMGVTIETATILYETLIGSIVNHLDAGDKVRIPGVGTMEKVTREAHTARVPGTTNTVEVPARSKISLKSSPKDI